MEHASKYEPGTSLDAWLFTMARRIWLNEKRSERIRAAGGLVSVEEFDLPATNADPETNIFARQVFHQVMTLPEAQRTAVVLVYVEGYKYREAAEILEIPVGTIMSRLAAARKTIQMSSEDRKVRKP